MPVIWIESPIFISPLLSLSYYHLTSESCSLTTELSARAFFYSQRVPVLDGNVIRVLTRVRRIGAPIQLATTNTLLWELADHLVDPKRPGDFNQSLMELGAILCTPKQPSCSVCPLGAIEACMAYTEVCLEWISSLQLVSLKQATMKVSATHPKASGFVHVSLYLYVLIFIILLQIFDYYRYWRLCSLYFGRSVQDWVSTSTSVFAALVFTKLLWINCGKIEWFLMCWVNFPVMLWCRLYRCSNICGFRLCWIVLPRDFLDSDMVAASCLLRSNLQSGRNKLPREVKQTSAAWGNHCGDCGTCVTMRQSPLSALPTSEKR